MNAQSQAHGLHRDLVNPKHFCSHKAGKPEHGCTGPSVCRCGQTWVGPWVRGRYFLNSEDELRSKESPDPSPFPLSLQDVPLWASPPLHSAILSLPASPCHPPTPPPPHTAFPSISCSCYTSGLYFPPHPLSYSSQRAPSTLLTPSL